MLAIHPDGECLSAWPGGLRGVCGALQEATAIARLVRCVASSALRTSAAFSLIVNGAGGGPWWVLAEGLIYDGTEASWRVEVRLAGPRRRFV